MTIMDMNMNMNTQNTELHSYRVITMTGGTRTIKVYGVSHISTLAFYEKVSEMITGDVDKGFTIHYEGMRGVPDKYTLSPLYSDIAEELQLASQKEHLNDNIPGDIVDMHWDDFDFLTKTRISFTRGSLETITSFLKKNKDNSKKERFREELVSKLFVPQKKSQSFWSRALLGKTLTDERSRYAAQKALDEDNDLVLIWGLGHIDEIVRILCSRGFSVVSSQELIPDDEKNK